MSEQQTSSHNQPVTNPQSTSTQPAQQGTGFWSTVKSVLGAMFGVQSEEQRQKDFEKGNALQFILGGIVFVILFILTILYFVNSALESAGQ